MNYKGFFITDVNKEYYIITMFNRQVVSIKFKTQEGAKRYIDKQSMELMQNLIITMVTAISETYYKLKPQINLNNNEKNTNNDGNTNND